MPIISQILTIIELTLQIVKMAMESQTPEVRATLWRQHMERMDWWEKLFDKLKLTD